MTEQEGFVNDTVIMVCVGLSNPVAIPFAELIFTDSENKPIIFRLNRKALVEGKDFALLSPDGNGGWMEDEITKEEFLAYLNSPAAKLDLKSSSGKKKVKIIDIALQPAACDILKKTAELLEKRK